MPGATGAKTHQASARGRACSLLRRMSDSSASSGLDGPVLPETAGSERLPENVSVFTSAFLRACVTVDVRSLVKLQAATTAFRIVVTVAAGLLGLAILAGVTETFALASAVLLLLVALVGPLLHGWLAIVLRNGRDWALEATLIGTVLLWLLDGGTVLAVHLQGVFADRQWTYILAIVLVSIVHIVGLVQAGRLFAARRAEEETEPGPEDLESETA